MDGTYIVFEVYTAPVPFLTQDVPAVPPDGIKFITAIRFFQLRFIPAGFPLFLGQIDEK